MPAVSPGAPQTLLHEDEPPERIQVQEDERIASSVPQPYDVRVGSTWSGW